MSKKRDIRYFLTGHVSLKWLEKKCLYDIEKDELYELDDEGYEFLAECASDGGGMTDDSEFIQYCKDEGILQDKKSRDHRLPANRAIIPSLRYLELQITDRCNLNCRHCYIGGRGARELEVGAIESIMKELETMQGLRLLITGGEPLLHSSFEELNDILPEYELRKVLFTNGMLLDTSILKGLNVQEIQISIDGCEEAHDFLRGKGSYKRSMEAVRAALDAGHDVSISTMVHAGNLSDFDHMEASFRGMGIREWTVDIPCLEGNLKNNLGVLPPPDISGKYLGYGYGDGLHGGGSGYECGLHLMSVMADGKAAKCAFYSNEPVGHISEGLERCWKRIEHRRLSELECDCDALDECRGGCRFRASTNGNPLAKDLYRCSYILK
ncbi:MAG: radical SAM protein [Nitrospirota bacterium]|nr:MAG: radical SAM protein [Nitrospirota bacterium]